MSTASISDRHLSRGGLLEYLGAGAASIIQIAGDPIGYLVIDPPSGTLALRFPRGSGHAPDLAPYRHFSAATLAWSGETWLQLEVTTGADLLEAYPVLCAVADRVQLEHRSFEDSVIDALATYRELLAGLARLSDEEETGLFGELLVLKHLITETGKVEALTAWRGPNCEEHDFGLTRDDVEVKTTTAESRRHWIGDLAQLVPSAGRPLWLLSLQLTTAGEGTTTLPQLIAVIRGLLDADTVPLFETRLKEIGWRPDHAVLYRRGFRLRSAPATFPVIDTFPALTPSAIATAGLDVVRFPKVTYLLDLTGLLPHEPPSELIGIDKEASA